MERMVLARLKFKIGPLHHNLMGCVQGKGTMDAVATLAKLASDSKHRRSGSSTLGVKACYAIFLDYEKAFEMADPTTILNILAVDKGVTGKMLGWIQDFLSNRKGFSVVQGERSDTFPLFNGTPQGAVLSPYLFNILIDKLLRVLEDSLGPDITKNITIVSYADDLMMASNHSAAPMILEKALSHLESASTALGLQISISKTKAMAWNHSHFLPKFDFHIYKGKVEWVREFKYLGVVFDDNLSFLAHAHHLRKRASKRVNVLKHMAGSPYGATQATLIHYYKACIRPILDYGSIVFPIACPSAIRLLETIQNSALKIALRVPQNTRTALVLAESGVTSIDDRSKALATVAWAKICAFTNHPCTNQKEMHVDARRFQKDPTTERNMPLDMALQKISELYQIPSLDPPCLKVWHPSTNTIASLVKFDIKGLYKSKEKFTSQELVTLESNISNYIELEYANCINFYIDGSVNPETGHAACAFIQSHSPPLFADSFRLSNSISSTQAELGAVQKVCEYLQSDSFYGKGIVVHCDSMPALLTIKGCDTEDLFCKQKESILSALTSLITQQNLHITFHWIPSHIGLPGNEQVDIMAKEALGNQDIDFEVPASVGQIKAIIRKAQKTKSLEFFNQVLPSSVHPSSVSQRCHYISCNPNLKEQAQSKHPPSIQQSINLLRLNPVSWCYEHDSVTQCGYCHLNFSPHHYLIDCPVTAADSFLQLLEIDQHSLYPVYQAPLILKQLSRAAFSQGIVDHFNKYPVKVVCKWPEHGSYRHNWIHIPKGL